MLHLSAVCEMFCLVAETSCSPAQYNKAVQLAAHGKQLMMRYNLRLVYAIAKNFQNRGLEMDDMLPEGVAGLEKAIEKFEPEKGFKFSTYSHWWIRQHIYRCGLHHVICPPYWVFVESVDSCEKYSLPLGLT